MCRISKVCDDWASKGCHVHVGRVEVSIHPDHLGGITFDSPFASTPEPDWVAAKAIVLSRLEDPQFRAQLRSAIQRATEYMPSVTGFWATKANGRLLEFKYLLLALERMESSP